MASKRTRGQEEEITAKSLISRTLLQSTLLVDTLSIAQIEAALSKSNPNKSVDPCASFSSLFPSLALVKLMP